MFTEFVVISFLLSICFILFYNNSPWMVVQLMWQVQLEAELSACSESSCRSESDTFLGSFSTFLSLKNHLQNYSLLPVHEFWSWENQLLFISEIWEIQTFFSSPPNFFFEVDVKMSTPGKMWLECLQLWSVLISFLSKELNNILGVLLLICVFLVGALVAKQRLQNNVVL